MSLTGDVLLVGCGRLGSAIVQGWLATGALEPHRLIILTPSSKAVADQAAALGARINPPLDALTGVGAVVLAVKPAAWRAAADPLIPALPQDAAVLSVMAGVASTALRGAFGRRSLARLMPTTAVATGAGVAALWADGAASRIAAEAVFSPIAKLIPLADEDLMHAAVGVSGSAPAFFLALVQALGRAGAAHGLRTADAEALARGALLSAASVAGGDAPLDDLIGRIASPGGTTRAGLDALAEALEQAAGLAVAAAARRSRELGA